MSPKVNPQESEPPRHRYTKSLLAGVSVLVEDGNDTYNRMFQPESFLPFKIPRSKTWRKAWAKVIRADPCCWCGQISATPTIEHALTRGSGGPNAICNIVGACFECNNSRGSAPIWFYLLARAVNSDTESVRRACDRYSKELFRSASV